MMSQDEGWHLEQSTGSTVWGVNTYMEMPGELKQKMYLANWMGRKTLQTTTTKKNERMRESQCLPAVKTVGPSHRYNTLVGAPTSTTNEERKMTENCSRQNPTIYSHNKNKDYHQAISKPMLEV